MEKKKTEVGMEEGKKKEIAEAGASDKVDVDNKKTESKVKPSSQKDKSLTQPKMAEPKGEAKSKPKECTDKDCYAHGNLKLRGRVFEGTVIKKFHKRVVIEFERMVYVRKYERYKKSKTKIHARLPVCIEDKVNVGDLVRVQECRPLSKIIHFVVVAKIKSAEEKK